MKPIYLDLEATGIDPYQDRIVEIALVGEEESEDLISLVNPGVPIPPEATAVHGIRDEDVADAPGIADLAPRIRELLEGRVIVGYGSRRYDIPLLDSELQRRAGRGLHRTFEGFLDVPEIDLLEVWKNAEPRSLVSAARRFAGVEMEEEDGTHRAGADARVLPDVMAGMLRDLVRDVEGSYIDVLRELSVPEWAVDRDGKFKKRDDDGVVVFAFGKHRGEPAARHKSYLEWMMEPGTDFSPETKAHCRRFVEMIERHQRARR